MGQVQYRGGGSAQEGMESVQKRAGNSGDAQGEPMKKHSGVQMAGGWRSGR